MAVSTIKPIGTDGSVTRIAGTRGSITWNRVGKIIVLTGFIQLDASVNTLSNLFSGLPISAVSDVTPLCAVNSSTGVQEVCWVNNGYLRNVGTWASGIHRISGSYVENVENS